MLKASQSWGVGKPVHERAKTVKGGGETCQKTQSSKQRKKGKRAGR